MRPLVQRMDAEEQRNKKRCHERKCSRTRFKDPPRDKSPRSTDEMMQHQQWQATHGNSEPEQICDEVGPEELLYHRGNLSSSWRSCAGKSRTGAFWLNCSTRIYATMAQRSRGLICTE